MPSGLGANRKGISDDKLVSQIIQNYHNLDAKAQNYILKIFLKNSQTGDVDDMDKFLQTSFERERSLREENQQRREQEDSKLSESN